MAFDLVATLTDTTRARIAQSMIDGKGFQVTHFAVSNAGHNLSDPTTALTPDPSVIVCPGSPPIFGPDPIDSQIRITQFCPQFTCILGPAEAIASLSNLCLIATIISSPIPMDAEVGSTFLFAIGNFPLTPHPPATTMTFNVTVQF